MKTSHAIEEHNLLTSYENLLSNNTCLPGKTIDETEELLLQYASLNFEEDNAILKKMAELKELYDLVNVDCFIDGSIKIIEKNGKKKVTAGAGFSVPSLGISGSTQLPSSYDEKLTNSHIAEYEATMFCLDSLVQTIEKPERLTLVIHSDSLNLVNQLIGLSRLRNPISRQLKETILSYQSIFKKIIFIHCPREQNQEADKLAKAGWNEEEIVTYYKGDS